MKKGTKVRVVVADEAFGGHTGFVNQLEEKEGHVQVVFGHEENNLESAEFGAHGFWFSVDELEEI